MHPFRACANPSATPLARGIFRYLFYPVFGLVTATFYHIEEAAASATLIFYAPIIQEGEMLPGEHAAAPYPASRRAARGSALHRPFSMMAAKASQAANTKPDGRSSRTARCNSRRAPRPLRSALERRCQSISAGRCSTVAATLDGGAHRAHPPHDRRTEGGRGVHPLPCLLLADVRPVSCVEISDDFALFIGDDALIAITEL